MNEIGLVVRIEMNVEKSFNVIKFNNLSVVIGLSLIHLCEPVAHR